MSGQKTTVRVSNNDNEVHAIDVGSTANNEEFQTTKTNCTRSMSVQKKLIKGFKQRTRTSRCQVKQDDESNTFKTICGRPKNLLDVQTNRWTSKQFVGRPNNCLDVQKVFGRPKKFLEVQNIF